MMILRITLGILAVTLAAGCSTARRSEALNNAPILQTETERRGQLVFMQHCHTCHTGGAGALGPGLNDKPQPSFLIRFQVRRGLGAMPAFDEKKLSAAKLDDMLVYLKMLRRARE